MTTLLDDQCLADGRDGKKMEAKEKTIKIEPPETLPRARIGLRRNNAIVAVQMARNWG
jgi:hypothetical protein